MTLGTGILFVDDNVLSADAADDTAARYPEIALYTAKSAAALSAFLVG